MTRKKSRGGSVLKGLVVGTIAAFLIVILMYFAFPDANADERDDINDLKDTIDDLDNDIENIDEDIIDARIDILNFNTLVSDAKDNLRDIKKELNNSWEAAKDVIEAEDNLIETQKDHKESRQDWLQLLRDKSNILKQLKDLGKQLTADEITLKANINSNLVKKIGIINSQVCISLNQAGLKSSCPSYNDLIIFDTSNTDVSGKFITDDNGYFHRDNTAVYNSHRYYDFDDELHIFIDPPSNMINRIKLIEIRTNFNNFFDKQQMVQHQEFELINVTQAGNSTTKAINYSYQNQTQDFGLIIFHDRYANAGCNLIVINADKWQSLLNDTINFVRNNCDEDYTEIITKEVIPINTTIQDITTSQKWKDDKRLEFIKEFCIFVYGSCSDDY